LIYNILRTATVKSLSYCNIAYLKRNNYDKINSKYPEFEQMLKNWADVYRDPWKKYIYDILNQAEYFSLMDEKLCYELFYKMELMKLESG